MQIRHSKVLAIAGGVSLLTGCMTFELEGDGELTAESVNDHATVHGSLYGFQWSQFDVQKCDDNLGLYRAEYHTNVAFLAASVLTLGLYVPQTVEWWCQAPPRDDDDGELLLPDDEHSAQRRDPGASFTMRNGQQS